MKKLLTPFKNIKSKIKEMFAPSYWIYVQSGEKALVYDYAVGFEEHVILIVFWFESQPKFDLKNNPAECFDIEIKLEHLENWLEMKGYEWVKETHWTCMEGGEGWKETCINWRETILNLKTSEIQAFLNDYIKEV